MSKPTDIYKDFSRELLENFVYQLQMSKVVYEGYIESGVEPESEVRLDYQFECPSEEAALQLKEYILEQCEDPIEIEPADSGLILKGLTEEFSLDLATILAQVGYWCDAGQQFNCRFDGWALSGGSGAGSDDSEDEGAFDEDNDENNDAPKSIQDVMRMLKEAGENSEAFTTEKAYPFMVIARIPEDIQPIARAEKYEDPLTEILQREGWGEVTGGGTQMDAEFKIKFVDLEIWLTNLEEALEGTKAALRKLGAPAGTELRFDRPCSIPVFE